MPKKVESPLLTGDKDQERETFLVMMIKNNTNATEIAADLGISSQAVSNVAHRHNNSRRVIEHFENLPIQV